MSVGLTKGNIVGWGLTTSSCLGERSHWFLSLTHSQGLPGCPPHWHRRDQAQPDGIRGDQGLRLAKHSESRAL